VGHPGRQAKFDLGQAESEAAVADGAADQVGALSFGVPYAAFRAATPLGGQFLSRLLRRPSQDRTSGSTSTAQSRVKNCRCVNPAICVYPSHRPLRRMTGCCLPACCRTIGGMVTEDDVRQIALSLPATAEKPYNRLPSFRVRSSLFIRVHELPDTLFARCASLDERNELLRAEPGKFFITPHYDGYPGILVRRSEVDRDELAELVTEAWRICAPKRLLAAYDTAHPPAP